jgi:hypothetical protein
MKWQPNESENQNAVGTDRQLLRQGGLSGWRGIKGTELITSSAHCRRERAACSSWMATQLIARSARLRSEQSMAPIAKLFSFSGSFRHRVVARHSLEGRSAPGSNARFVPRRKHAKI